MSFYEEIIDVNMDGFQVVSGEMFRSISRTPLPTMTLWCNSVSFSKAAVIALNSCDRVRIEVNPKTRCVLIVPVTEKDKDAVRWAKTGKAPQSRKIDCPVFASQLYESWGWEKKTVYRATGRIVSNEKRIMLLFDFTDPEKWPMKEKATEISNA